MQFTLFKELFTNQHENPTEGHECYENKIHWIWKEQATANDVRRHLKNEKQIEHQELTAKGVEFVVLLPLVEKFF